MEEVRVRSVEVEGRRTESTTKTSWRMVTEAAEGGVVVHSRDVELVEAEGLDPRASDRLRLELAAAAEISALISSEGELRQLVGREGLDNGAFQDKATAEWNGFLGAWADTRIELGQFFTWEGEMKDGLGAVTQEWAATGWVPCRDDEEALRCVRLETYTFPHRDGTLRMIDEVVEPLLEEGVSITRGSHTVHDVVVADPYGLIPYRYERRAVTKVEIVVDEETAELVHEDRMVRTFDPPASLRSTPAPRGTNPDAIALHFGWPAGWNVPVTEERVRWQEGMGHRNVSTLTVRSRMTTEEVEGVIVIRGHDHELDTEGADERLVESMLESIRVTEGLWTEVSAEGEFLRVGGLERYGERMAQFLAEKNLPPEGAGRLAAVFSPEFLAAKAEDDWNLFVGFWLGAGMEIGDVLEYTGDGPNRVTGEPMGMVIRWTFTGWTPCTRSEEELRCVRLETVVVPNEEEVNAFVVQMLGPILEREGVALSFGSHETHAVLVAEPDGLIPHRFERRTLTKGRLVVDGQEAEFEAGDISTRTYHHP